MTRKDRAPSTAPGALACSVERHRRTLGQVGQDRVPRQNDSIRAGPPRTRAAGVRHPSSHRAAAPGPRERVDRPPSENRHRRHRRSRPSGWAAQQLPPLRGLTAKAVAETPNYPTSSAAGLPSSARRPTPQSPSTCLQRHPEPPFRAGRIFGQHGQHPPGRISTGTEPKPGSLRVRMEARGIPRLSGRGVTGSLHLELKSCRARVSPSLRRRRLRLFRRSLRRTPEPPSRRASVG